MQNERDWDRLGKALENAQPIQINIMPYRAFTLCGLLQLALRHPGLPHATAPYEIAQEMVKNLQEILRQEAPFIAEMIEDGWNEELDVPIREFKSGGCKYGDLDQAHKNEVILNGAALHIAVEMIAKLTGRSENLVGDEIGQLAIKRTENSSQSECNRLIKGMDQDVEPIVIDLNPN